MNKDKIEQLKKKRLLLKEEVRLKALRKRISLQLGYLDEHGFDFKVYYNHEHLDWISDNVPLRKKDGYNGLHDYQVDVDNTSPNCNSIYCLSDDLVVNKIREQFLTIASKDCKLIVCHNGGDPEIEISVEALVSNPLKFFSGRETWILIKDKSWVIENIWDQETYRFIQLQNMEPILVTEIISQHKKE